MGLSRGKKIVVACLALVCGVVAGYQALPSGASKADHEERAQKVAHVEALAAFDVSDERQLVGFAENVFVGRVVERIGTEGPSGNNTLGIPLTQSSVEVVENVKGKLDGMVTVSQQGGEDPALDAVVVLEGDPLLEPGQTAMFTTRFDEQNGWHVVTTPGYGDRRIKDDAERKELVGKFKKAKEGQIDPAPKKMPDEELRKLKDSPAQNRSAPPPARP